MKHSGFQVFLEIFLTVIMHILTTPNNNILIYQYYVSLAVLLYLNCDSNEYLTPSADFPFSRL